MSSLFQQFQAPRPQWRGAPFWSWNGRLEKEELIRQVRIFKEMGFGGFFMHSRIGLETPYLSPEWFNAVKVCVDEARKQGIAAWLYDEDRWPSGAAGGIVTKEERFRCQELILHISDTLDSSPAEFHPVADYIGSISNGILTHYRRIAIPAEPLQKGEKYLRIGWQYTAKSGRFNGESYLNILNREAVRDFIEKTHEQYAATVGDAFGKEIPGIFTDEPCLLPLDVKTSGYPWDTAIPEAFQKQYGSDLLEKLPEIFLPTPEGVSAARARYWELCTALFSQNYCGQIADWCKEHNLTFTGHLLLEDDLNSQAFCAGAVMRSYQYMDAPGIDVLTEHWNIFQTAKQCTSVARQFGRERLLSELYGCTGWDFPFEAHKALGDWHAALGINLRCHHLSWYTMAGYAKRDFPASIDFHSPWYKSYTCIEDYFARIFSTLAPGKEKRNLLMIHPMESVWFSAPVAPIDTPIPEQIAHLNDQWIHLTNVLLENQLDFDYGDEEICAKIGTLHNDSLFIGKAAYKAVLLPQLTTIRTSTLKLLESFSKAGGSVFYLGNAPAYVDYQKSDKAQVAYKHFVNVTEETLISALNPKCRLVEVRDSKTQNLARTLLFHLSENEENTILFLCNTSTPFNDDTKAAPRVVDRMIAYPNLQVTLLAPQKAHLYELHPESGKITKVPFSFSDGRFHFSTAMDRLETRLFVCTDEEYQGTARPLPLCSAETQITLSAPVRFACSEENVMVLDRADVTIDGKQAGTDLNILEADDYVRQHLGLVIRTNGVRQPWAVEKMNYSAAVTETFHFQCSEVPDAPITLVLEQPELHKVFINGHLLHLQSAGYWVDPALQRFPLPAGYLQQGANECVVQCNFTQKHRGLEPIYLLGNFGLYFKGQETMGSFPKSLAYGDWCQQGLRSYGGNVTYTFTLENLPKCNQMELEFTEWRGCALEVTVNGQGKAILGWPPYRVALPASKLRFDGTDLLEITVLGHRRNCFGPSYNSEKWPYLTNPANFKARDQQERQIVPVGLLKPPILHCLS